MGQAVATPQNIPPFEENGVPLAERRQLSPFCTCILGDGSHNEARGGVRHTFVPHLDPKGRVVCQVHNPVDKNEYESRAIGGEDNFPRN